MEYLSALLIAVLFSPITWIIVVVIILIRSDKKKKAAAQLATQNAATIGADNTNGATTPVAPPPPPKPKDPMTKWNWLLYIGSFLIIMAMIYFIDSVNDAAVAPTTIILTLLIYCAGLGIYKAVDYLRPVGKAFTYSALCMIPLWLISLGAIHIPSEIIPLIVSIVFMIASFIAAYMLKSPVLGYVSMLSPIAFIWPFHSLIGNTTDIGLYLYFLFISPIITAIVPLALWLTKPKWLPLAFRHASMGLGLVLIPMATALSAFLFLSPEVGAKAPFLRTVCAVAFLGYSIANYKFTKKHGFFVAMRFAAQLLITGALWDCLNFSIFSFSSTTVTADYTAALVCAIVWLLTFLAQVVYSLYAKTDNEKDASLERAVGLISIIGIFNTPMLCSNFAKIPYAIVWIVICLVTAILGVLHSMRYKNVLWSLATVASILIAPIIFGYNIAVPQWGSAAYLAIYSVIGVVFLLGYYYLSRIQKKESDIVGITALSIVSFAVFATSADLSISGVGFLIVTIYALAFGFLAKMNAFYEVAIYLFTLSLFSFSGNIFDAIVGKNTRGLDYYNANYQELTITLTVIRAHIIGLAFLVTSWLYERTKAPSQQVRQIIGFSLFSLIMSFACLGSSSLVWGIVFLIEQVAALLYSVTTHRTWMTWFSSIEVFIITLRLTGGPSYIWLGIIGIGLIAFVTYQLRNARNKMLRDANTNNPTPVAPTDKEELVVGGEAATEEPELDAPKDETPKDADLKDDKADDEPKESDHEEKPAEE